MSEHLLIGPVKGEGGEVPISVLFLLLVPGVRIILRRRRCTFYEETKRNDLHYPTRVE